VRDSRYAHRQAGLLIEEISRMINGPQPTDLSDEIAIQRTFVGDALEHYNTVREMPVDVTDAGQVALKNSMLMVSRAQLDGAIAAVKDTALTMSRITRNLDVKRDYQWLSGFMQSLTHTIDMSLSEYAAPMQSIGINATHIADRLSGAVAQQLQDHSNIGAGAGKQLGDNLFMGTGMGISNRPTRITADQIVVAMDDTIPVCDADLVPDTVLEDNFVAAAPDCAPAPHPAQQVQQYCVPLQTPNKVA
jgi:hypothetical protein